MPAQPFTVHVDPDDLARLEVAAAVSLPSAAGAEAGRPEPDRTTADHHGARDARLAARQRSGRDRAGRAAGAGGGRSYAFRRS
jgi:hypothetical protein